MSDADFLDWVADRFVHVYGVEANMDYVLKLRRMAEKAREKPNSAALVPRAWELLRDCSKLNSPLWAGQEGWTLTIARTEPGNKTSRYEKAWRPALVPEPKGTYRGPDDNLLERRCSLWSTRKMQLGVYDWTSD